MRRPVVSVCQVAEVDGREEGRSVQKTRTSPHSDLIHDAACARLQLSYASVCARRQPARSAAPPPPPPSHPARCRLAARAGRDSTVRQPLPPHPCRQTCPHCCCQEAFAHIEGALREGARPFSMPLVVFDSPIRPRAGHRAPRKGGPTSEQKQTRERVSAKS